MPNPALLLWSHLTDEEFKRCSAERVSSHFDFNSINVKDKKNLPDILPSPNSSVRRFLILRFDVKFVKNKNKRGKQNPALEVGKSN